MLVWQPWSEMGGIFQIREIDRQPYLVQQRRFTIPTKKVACLHMCRQCIPGFFSGVGYKVVIVMRGGLNSWTGYNGASSYYEGLSDYLPTYLGIRNGYDVCVLVKSGAIEGKPKVSDLCVIKWTIQNLVPIWRPPKSIVGTQNLLWNRKQIETMKTD